MRIVTRNAKVIAECQRVIKCGAVREGNTCKYVRTLPDGQTEFEITFTSLLNIQRDFPTLSDHTATIILG